jgi:hypothetical protein
MSNSDIPATDFDDIENQDEEDAVFGATRAIIDVPDESEDDGDADA